jgi:tRNA (cmo5U34)-methyltransferase
MNRKLSDKSTIEEMRERFDTDVERFSNLETGQSATIDAPLAMELIPMQLLSLQVPLLECLILGVVLEIIL